jgi:hypothetical protein
MAAWTFEVPEVTLEALKELASITDANERDGLAKLVQDALRTYEWIIAQQINGRTVTALEDADLAVLRGTERASGEREALGALVAPGKLPEARAYFERAPAA